MQRSRINRSHLEQIMKAGFGRASRSFSLFFSSSEGTGVTLHAKSEDNSAVPVSSNKEQDVYILMTQIIGDFSGKGYLVLSESESFALVQKFKPNSDELHFRESVLLEIDNIVSAAVVAELADVMGVEVYGDVPTLKKISTKDVMNFIQHGWESTESPKHVVIHSNLDMEDGSQLRPTFIWKLSSSALDRVANSRLAS